MNHACHHMHKPCHVFKPKYSQNINPKHYAYLPLQANPSEVPIKSVVFSQFIGMLDLVAAALTAAAIPFVRLDGSSSAKARADALCSFASADPASPRVFLASLKAGGVGMNLTAASHVHLMDPWWNPAVEEQAMVIHTSGFTRVEGWMHACIRVH